MKKLFVVFTIATFAACGSGSSKKAVADSAAIASADTTKALTDTAKKIVDSSKKTLDTTKKILDSANH